MAGMQYLAVFCALAFGSLLLFLSAAKMALAIVAAVAAVTVFRRPILGLMLFAFVATLIPYTTVQLGIRITLSEAMLALTWVGVFWRLSLGDWKWQWGKTEQRMLHLMLFSAIPFVVGQLVIHAEGNGIVNWVRWLMNLSLLFLTPMMMKTEESRDRLIVMLLLGTLAMLLLSIGYFIKDRDANTFIPVLEKLKYAHPEAVKDIFSANFSRMASPWVHPNLTGGVLVLFIPLAFYYGITRTRWRKWLGLSVAILGAAGLMFSISRGAIVSLALVMMWLAWLRAPHAGRIMLTGTILVGAAVMFYPPLHDRLSTMFSAKNASTEVRMDEYKHFPQAVARYPLGIGFKVDPPPDDDLLGISNLWLNCIYKIGVAGMLLFIAVTNAWWAEVKPRAKIKALDHEQAIWLGSSAGLVAALLTGLFDHYYSFTMVLIALFWMMMAISLHSARRLFPQTRTHKENPHASPHLSF